MRTRLDDAGAATEVRRRCSQLQGPTVILAAALCALPVVLAIWFAPETKGKPLPA